MIDHQDSHPDDTLRRRTAARLLCCLLTIALAGSAAHAADVTFNITLVGESDPFSGTRNWADVWGYGNFAYVGSDTTGVGMAIFDISNPASPQYIGTYAGSKLQDVKVYDGIGYFASDSTNGVDIVNLSDPYNPVMLSRIDSSIGGHNKVHNVTINDGFLYTADNQTDVVKVFNVTNPSNPTFVASIDLGAPTGVSTHDTTVLDGRMYVSSKSGSTSTGGWTHIYDVSSIGAAGAVLLKAFPSGPRTHSNWPTEDGNALFVATEVGNGVVQVFDISMIDQPNDPDNPVLLKTLTRSNVGIDAHSPHNPVVRGHLLFVSWYEAGLQVFNIVDPANPVHVGAFDTYPGTSTSFRGNWGVDPSLGLDKILLGDRQRGLIIVDATDVLAPGDYDQNGIVDQRDFDTWRAAFGTDNRAADGNKDGIVDAADYVLWRKNLGQTLPPNLASGSSSSTTPAVPEPGAILLFAIGVIAIMLQSSRQLNRSPSSPRFHERSTAQTYC